MMNRLLVTLLAGGALVLTACGDSEPPADETSDVESGEMMGDGAEMAVEEEDLFTLEEAVAADYRNPDDRARDRYRHPFETLQFFGIEPDMTVIEIWPGMGYYMDIIAPYLAADGQYVSAGFPPDAESEYVQRINKAVAEKIAARPEIYGDIRNVVLTQGSYDIAPEGTVDMILTFRNVHNWMGGEYENDVFQAMYRALKPGGILGIVEHRGNPAVEQDPKAESGYVNEDYVVKLAETVGFQLVDSSEINANSADSKDHPKGVWTLPPVLRLGDEDRAKYEAIGESDRMTLKFKKPETTGLAALRAE